MKLWLDCQGFPKCTLVIVFEQSSQFGIHPSNLHLIYTHHKGHQSISQACVGTAGSNQTTPRHAF